MKYSDAKQIIKDIKNRECGWNEDLSGQIELVMKWSTNGTEYCAVHVKEINPCTIRNVPTVWLLKILGKYHNTTPPIHE